MRATSDADLLAEIERLLPHIAPGPELSGGLTPDLTRQISGCYAWSKGTGEDTGELIESARYLYAERPIPLDEKAAALLDEGGRTLLADLTDELAAVEPWSADATEAAVRAFSERIGLKLGAVAQPLRAALTGRTTSPGIFEVLAVLGKDETMARLADLGRTVVLSVPRGNRFKRPISSARGAILQCTHGWCYAPETGYQRAPAAENRLRTRPLTKGSLRHDRGSTVMDATTPGKKQHRQRQADRRRQGNHVPDLARNDWPFRHRHREAYHDTGMFTYDPGFTSTGSCESKITYIDGDGALAVSRLSDRRARGNGDFLEVSYLLLYGELPTAAQKTEFEYESPCTRWCTSR